MFSTRLGSNRRGKWFRLVLLGASAAAMSACTVESQQFVITKAFAPLVDSCKVDPQVPLSRGLVNVEGNVIGGKAERHPGYITFLDLTNRLVPLVLTPDPADRHTLSMVGFEVVVDTKSLEDAGRLTIVQDGGVAADASAGLQVPANVKEFTDPAAGEIKPSSTATFQVRLITPELMAALAKVPFSVDERPFVKATVTAIAEFNHKTMRSNQFDFYIELCKRASGPGCRLLRNSCDYPQDDVGETFCEVDADCGEGVKCSVKGECQLVE